MKSMSQFEYANANPLLEKARKRATLQRNELLPFSCRGCGNYCCSNLPDPIYVLPPEYIRIQWYIKRNPASQAALLKHSIYSYDNEHVSGLPVLQLDFHDLMWQGHSIRACPFLAVREEEGASELLTCLIHPARPFTCRIFPIGMAMEGFTVEKEVSTSYYLMSFCPGFEMPAPGERNLPGYHPPSPTQTVGDLLDDQMDADQFEEVLYHFFDVMSHYYHQGWHLDRPGMSGTLTPAMYEALGRVFYRVPDPPQDESEDHEQIVQFLHGLRNQAEEIMQMVRRPPTLSLFG